MAVRMHVDGDDDRGIPAGREGAGGGHALFTDLYELTMLQAYVEEGMTDTAVFSLFVRRLPARRNVLLACGLEAVLDYLSNLRFDDGEIAYLASLGRFSERFLAWLRDFRFEGDVHAVPEGTPVFPNEPILEVVAPLPQAQLVETFVMNQIHLQTVLASKALRVVSAAKGRPVIDFGARRMQGIDAAMKGVRALYIGGVAATSNVAAGRRYGIPVSGTMAHSYIQAHGEEATAFRAFADLYPETVLLVDTYDTIKGVRNVVDLARTLGDRFRVRAVRLDSGDLSLLAREARRILDEAGLRRVGIFASGGLDEDSIDALVSSGAPIDAFGVGTSMGVSDDVPALDIAYKLCEYAGRGCVKLSPGKPVFPGRKQIFRQDEGGEDVRDVIGRTGEALPGRPLLLPVMRNGRRLPVGDVDLRAARDYAQRQVARLPERVRGLAQADPPYPVDISPALSHFQEAAVREAGDGEGRGPAAAR
ncbi:MAG: nicotinate phosphoribosyltransferase [Magnetospirillum sp.]|nr:nicotinate phosphoribosyltransferase [Magnetospirillum sp.]